jgi:RNA polymerase-binding transcription factor DksA
VTTEGVRAELDADRQRTVAQIAALSAVIDDVVASQADVATDDEHDPEGATIAFERQRVAALLDRARDHLSALDAAAARLDAGTYGGCERCGQPIGAERQAARPAAATCISCAASSG